MKSIFLFIVSALALVACGVKAPPVYYGEEATDSAAIPVLCNVYEEDCGATDPDFDPRQDPFRDAFKNPNETYIVKKLDPNRHKDKKREKKEEE